MHFPFVWQQYSSLGKNKEFFLFFFIRNLTNLNIWNRLLTSKEQVGVWLTINFILKAVYFKWRNLHTFKQCACVCFFLLKIANANTWPQYQNHLWIFSLAFLYEGNHFTVTLINTSKEGTEKFCYFYQSNRIMMMLQVYLEQVIKLDTKLTDLPL